MTKGICTLLAIDTHLDEYRHKRWPTMFARVPKKGEQVRSEDGHTLEVCQITHYQVEVAGEIEPRIEVELTKKYSPCYINNIT